MKDTKIVLKQGLDREQAATWLEDLAAGVRAGGVAVKSGDESLMSTVPQAVRAEVQAKRKKGVFKFSLEISWPEVEGAETDLIIEPVEGPIPQGPAREVRAVTAQEKKDQAPPPAAKGQTAPAEKTPFEVAEKKD